MDTMQMRALATGVLFGIWPLLMNRSGLNGGASALTLVVVQLVCILPFVMAPVLSNLGAIARANWLFAFTAGAIAAMGMLVLNDMLAKSTPQGVGTLIVLMIVAQSIVPALYQAFVGGITLKQVIGFGLAIAASVLLTQR